MVRLLLPFVLLLLLFHPGAADAEQHCRAAYAKPATIESVQADFRAYVGHCVRLRGLAVRDRLYASREATLEPDSPLDEKAAHSIVIYPTDVEGRPARAAWVEIVGTLASCADAHAAVQAMMAAHPDSIMMVTGYCHTSEANYIRPVSIRVVDDVPVPRLTEAEAPPEKRPLVEAPLSASGRAAHVAAARALVTAIAQGDEATYRRLTQPDVQDDLDRLNGGPAPSSLRGDLRSAHRAFVRERKRRPSFLEVAPPQERQQRVFVDRQDLGSDDDFGEYLTCWCRTGNCGGRWPVSRFDADNRPERPYLCVRTNGFVLGLSGKTVIQGQTDLQSAGFAEPDWKDPSAPRS
jgi:hypothetical protein